MKCYRLYISWLDEKAIKIIGDLREILNNEVEGDFYLEIIDILKSPDQIADEDEIMATPTLVKSFPPPRRKAIGYIADKNALLKLFA